MQCITKSLLPGNGFANSGKWYLRLDDGRIAIDFSGRIELESSIEDNVELVTLNNGTREVSFWRIKDKVYTLNFNKNIDFPQKAVFTDAYSAFGCDDGMYVKYNVNGAYGIFFINTGEYPTVEISLSFARKFKEIDYENDYFYVTTSCKKSPYEIYNLLGDRIDVSSYKTRLVGLERLRYDKRSIWFIEFNKKQIPEDILSVKVIEQGELRIIKVETDTKNYYYNEKLRLLFTHDAQGCTDKVVKPSRESIAYENACFIYRMEGEKVIQVSYVEFYNDKYYWRTLHGQNGIECYEPGTKHYRLENIDDPEELERFFVIDGAIYQIHDAKFIKLTHDICASKYNFVCTHCGSDYVTPYHYTILGYDKQNLCYIASLTTNKLFAEDSLSEFAAGIDEAKIYKGKKRVLVVNRDGEVILDEPAERIEVLKSYGKKVYVVAKDDSELRLYDECGHRLQPR